MIRAARRAGSPAGRWRVPRRASGGVRLAGGGSSVRRSRPGGRRLQYSRRHARRRAPRTCGAGVRPRHVGCRDARPGLFAGGDILDQRRLVGRMPRSRPADPRHARHAPDQRRLVGRKPRPPGFGSPSLLVAGATRLRQWTLRPESVRVAPWLAGDRGRRPRMRRFGRRCRRTAPRGSAASIPGLSGSGERGGSRRSPARSGGPWALCASGRSVSANGATAGHGVGDRRRKNFGGDNGYLASGRVRVCNRGSDSWCAGSILDSYQEQQRGSAQADWNEHQSR